MIGRASQAQVNQVSRFYAERICIDGDESLTATMLYEAYCQWCDRQKIRALALPEFCRLLRLLGVKKERSRGRIRYLGIALVINHLEGWVPIQQP